MNISRIIKTRRKELGMTQEQMADRLGVSAPAVNKWENNVTFPDITLLPPLARLLETDLNTLFAFREEMTGEEIAAFQQEIYEGAEKYGFSWAFEESTKLIRRYPSCHNLICSMAMMLNGMMILDTSVGEEERKRYEDELEKMFRQAAESDVQAIKEHALSMLVSFHIGREEYDEAQVLLDQITETEIDKSAMEICLAQKRGDLDKAAALAERKLLCSVSDAQSALIRMTEIAAEAGRIEEAEFYGEKCRNLTLDFDSMEATAFTALLEVAVKSKDKEKTLDILEEMLLQMSRPWGIRASRLYSHLIEDDSAEDFSKMFLPAFIAGVEKDDEFAFIRDEPRLKEILSKAKAAFI